MNPLSVTHVIGTLATGGVQRNLLTLLPRFDGARVASRVVCLREEGDLASALREAGIAVTLCPQRTRWDPASLRRLARELAGSDVVHAHMRRANTSAALARLFGGTGRLLFEEEDCALGKTWRHRLIDGLLFRVFRPELVCVSRAVAAANERWPGFPRGVSHILYNGVDVERFAGAGSKADGRAALGLPAEGVVVGSLGRLHAVKGFDVLLDAFALLRARHPDWRFCLAGDGPERGALLSRAAALGLGDALVWPGNRSDPERVLRALDVFALTSASEGHPAVLLEAMAGGVPVVATRAGGIPEVVDERHAFLVPVGDASAVATALEAAAGPEGAARAAAASVRVRDFSLEAWTASWTAFYERLAGRELP